MDVTHSNLIAPFQGQPAASRSDRQSIDPAERAGLLQSIPNRVFAVTL